MNCDCDHNETCAVCVPSLHGAKQATPSGRLFSLLRASVRRTDDTGFSSWPTPCSQDGPNGGPAQGEDRLPGAAPLVTALEALANFIDATDDGGPEKPTIWANGASFDLPILANAYRTVGMPLPWKFWEERDLRTLKALRPECRIPHAGIAHHALDDAVHQARLIQAIHKHLTEALA